MNMKTLQRALLVLLCGVSTSMLAQSSQNKEQLILKNGNVVRGTILEMNPGQTVKIQQENGGIATYKMDDVEKIVMGSGDYYHREKSSSSPEDRGYVNDFDVGYVFGI